MQLTPRYDGAPVLSLEMELVDPRAALIRQRRRMLSTLRALDAGRWREPSRCAGWSVQDVAAHLVGTDRFWALSIRSGLAGSPTRFLASFDPVATPEQLVGPSREQSPTAVLEDFAGSVDDLDDALAGVASDAWSTLAEAPPGHVPLRALVLHALWDGWVHERDVVVPLGLPATEEPDEVTACLAYVAALGPVFLATAGSQRTGRLEVAADPPATRFVVEAGPTVTVRLPVAADAGVPRLTGPAVDLIEALSFRAPLRHDLCVDDRWLLGGLAEVFEQPGFDQDAVDHHP